VSDWAAAARRETRKRLRNPFGTLRPRPLLVHAGHHRSGTVWFARVLFNVADYYGLRTQRLEAAFDIRPGMDLVIYEQARDLSFDRLPERPARVTHIVRDPRDMIVSGYHYHQWCNESWVTEPWDRYGGCSYRDVLKSLPTDEGLAEEIRVCSEFTFPGMVVEAWSHAEVLQIRYEELVADEDALFGRVFRHYGFSASATATAVSRARAFTFSRVTGRALGETQAGQHLRSGAPGAWRDVLSGEHQRLLEELSPGLLSALRYDLVVGEHTPARQSSPAGDA
jgi:hypothetical protein